jgi:hypothetical protein
LWTRCILKSPKKKKSPRPRDSKLFYITDSSGGKSACRFASAYAALLLTITMQSSRRNPSRVMLPHCTRNQVGRIEHVVEFRSMANPRTRFHKNLNQWDEEHVGLGALRRRNTVAIAEDSHGGRCVRTEGADHADRSAELERGGGFPSLLCIYRRKSALFFFNRRIGIIGRGSDTILNICFGYGVIASEEL